jgi:hypothetical protein
MVQWSRVAVAELKRATPVRPEEVKEHRFTETEPWCFTLLFETGFEKREPCQ